MSKKFLGLVFFAACLGIFSGSAHAQSNPLFDTPNMPAPQQLVSPEPIPATPQVAMAQLPTPIAAPAPIPMAAPTPPPVVLTDLAQAQIKGITNTLLQYPQQAPQILNNYLGIDPTKVNFDKFMEIVNTGDYQQVYAQVSALYNNAAAYNSGVMSNLPYYQAVAPQAAPIIAPTAAAPTATVASATYMPTAVFYTGLGAVTAAAVGVAAAVGTGSSGDSDSASHGADVFGRNFLPDIAPPASFVDTEFNAYPSSALNKENAQYAYAKGLTGQGVTIGFYDRFNSPIAADTELGSRLTYSNYSFLFDMFSTDQQFTNCVGRETDDDCDHGRMVMQYAAAAHDGSGTQGVAYEASLMANSWNASDVTNLADQAPDIINFSCTGCVPLQSSLDYIASKGILMTSATGNAVDQNGNPVNPIIAAQPDVASPAAHASDYDYQLIAVTGVEIAGNGTMIDPYNLCGNQKDYCMAAISTNGTSFAAPQVAGAAAIVKQGWNFLTAKQIGEILLLSAQDIGAPGVDAVYGHGLLDLQAAVNPIGSTSALSGHGMAMSFSPSTISQNQATPFGDAFSNSKNAKGNVVIVDSFGRDFDVKTQDNLRVAQKETVTPTAIQSFGKKNDFRMVKYSDQLSMRFNEQSDDLGNEKMAGFAEYNLNPVAKLSMGFSSDMEQMESSDIRRFDTANFISTDVFKNGYLNFSDNNQVYYQGVELAAGKNVKTKFSTYYSKNSDIDYFQPVNNQVTSDYTSTMAETIYTPTENLGFDFKNGVTHERDSLLGTKFTGSFDMANGANTYFTGLDASYDVSPHLNLFASYMLGMSQTKPSNTSAFSDVSDIMSDSFSVTATRSELMGHDKLSLSVGQPTRVMSGYASGVTAQVDHATGAISQAGFQQSLVPSGRTLLFQAAYQKDLSDTIGLNFAVAYTQQPYEQIDADPETSALVKLTYKFK